jgi:hypothetical protein
MDNEASSALKSYFTENNVSYQLVPPHCHIYNATARASGAFKEHVAAGLPSVDPYFPMHLWDQIVSQSAMTLDLLRTSRLFPQMSAAAHLYGSVDYNKTAFAPPGHNISVH